MPNYTKNLNLFKYDPSTDGDMPFDVQKALNDNFDKIDSNAGRIEEQLATKVDKFDAYKHSIPDYTNTIQLGGANNNNAITFTSYTAPVSGLLNLGWGAMINATNTIKILVNGHGVAWGYKTGNASFTTSFPVNAGDVVTWQLATGTSGEPYVYGFLCPYKEGGN